MKVLEHRNGDGRAFTLAGLLAVVAMLVLLSFLVVPGWSGAKRSSEAIRCMNNLQRLGMAMQLYTDEHEDVFPAHRNNGTTGEGTSLTNWWGTVLLGYARNDTNMFRCPELKGRRTDRGVRWEWRFDVHLMGYGYNAFFLGLHPYSGSTVTLGGVQFSSASTFKRNAVVRPTENLVLGESTPGPGLEWGSALWWPSGCMDTARSTSRSYEGVETLRHDRKGVTVFNDGHVELRRDGQINPPRDPYSGHAQAMTNANYWDPLRRGR